MSECANLAWKCLPISGWTLRPSLSGATAASSEALTTGVATGLIAPAAYDLLSVFAKVSARIVCVRLTHAGSSDW